jgi:hypothetical protein
MPTRQKRFDYFILNLEKSKYSTVKFEILNVIFKDISTVICDLTDFETLI